MKALKSLIWFNAIIFSVYGLAFMFFPHDLSLLVTDGVPSSASGFIDMRATYGGISLGFGLLLAYCTRKEETIELGLWGIMLIVGGMALGRLIGIFLDGSPNTIMYIYLALEILMVGLTYFMYAKSKDSFRIS